MSRTSEYADALVQAARSLTIADVCSVEDLAIHFRVSRAAVRRWLKLGLLPGRRIGRRWYVTRHAILASLRGESGMLRRLPR
jgi:hypothetical protein